MSISTTRLLNITDPGLAKLIENNTMNSCIEFIGVTAFVCPLKISKYNGAQNKAHC